MDHNFNILSVHIIQFYCTLAKNGYAIQMHTVYLDFILFGQKDMFYIPSNLFTILIIQTWG